MKPGYDERSGAQPVASVEHLKIHEGRDYLAYNVNIALGDDAILDTAIEVPADVEAHVEFFASGGGDLEIFVLKGVTVSTAGTAFTPVNRYFDKAASLAASSVVTINPTLSDTGTTKFHSVIGGGTGGNAGGGQGGIRREFIIENGDGICVFRVKNIAGAAKAVSGNLDFYELNGQ